MQKTLEELLKKPKYGLDDLWLLLRNYADKFDLWWKSEKIPKPITDLVFHELLITKVPDKLPIWIKYVKLTPVDQIIRLLVEKCSKYYKLWTSKEMFRLNLEHLNGNRLDDCEDLQKLLFPLIKHGLDYADLWLPFVKDKKLFKCLIDLPIENLEKLKALSVMY